MGLSAEIKRCFTAENAKIAGTFAVASLAATLPRISKIVNPWEALAFSVASFAMDRFAGKYFNSYGRVTPEANSNKQLYRFAVTVLAGAAFLGVPAMSAAFVLNQGAIMLTNRVALWLKN